MREPDSLIGFQQRLMWRGREVLTLADIWPAAPKAMVVGLNPAPVSVHVGHYYQGQVGQRQMARLVEAGLFVAPKDSTFLETEAERAGVGFTDLVKQPSRGEDNITQIEQEHGRTDLINQLAARAVPLVICVFRHPANAIMGGKSEIGFQIQPTPWGGHLFRMPGPYEKRSVASSYLLTLRNFLKQSANA